MERERQEVGKVTHYFSKISVAIVKLEAPLGVGDTILIRGNTTNFEQPVESIQMEHKNVENAEPGQDVGLKVIKKVMEKDIVYK
ncbi:MAG: translation elongation factor-like protein [Candidatus Bathyarchaeota archaeon]